MAVAAHLLEEKLRAAFPDAMIDLKDLMGDQDHYALTITSAAFIGKSRIAQHQMVHAALGSMVGGTLHALTMTTRSPMERVP